ncbi:MAG: ATP-binding protein [Anaerolineae bacterium]|nr:ATP-binding protein [Anaerolineae bacterium]
MSDSMLAADVSEQPPSAVPEPLAAAEGSPADVPLDLSAVPTVDLSLPGIPGFEKVARGAAQALAEQMGFSADRIEDVMTAVSEACMNAAEYGSGGDVAAKIHVVLRAGPAQLEVLVNDRATEAVPDPLPQPGLPDGTRGWGLFFITQLMDEVTFRRLPGGGNQVHMVIRLKNQPEAVAVVDAVAPGALSTAVVDVANQVEENGPDPAVPPSSSQASAMGEK